MSNRAYLVSNSTPLTASGDDHGERTYRQQDMISDGGSYLFPMLWFSAFRPDNIVSRLIEGYSVPCLMCPKETAMANLGAAKEMLCREFSNVSAHWPSWEAMVRDSQGSHLKVDATEIWDLGPDSFERDLREALSWFASPSERSRIALLSLSGLECDAATRELRLGGAPASGDNLYGLTFR